MDTVTMSSELFLLPACTGWSGLHISHQLFLFVPAVIAKSMASHSSKCFSLSAGHLAQEGPVWRPLRSVSAAHSVFAQGQLCMCSQMMYTVGYTVTSLSCVLTGALAHCSYYALQMQYSVSSITSLPSQVAAPYSFAGACYWSELESVS